MKVVASEFMSILAPEPKRDPLDRSVTSPLPPPSHSLPQANISDPMDIDNDDDDDIDPEELARLGSLSL